MNTDIPAWLALLGNLVFGTGFGIGMAVGVWLALRWSGRDKDDDTY